ncbi:hypothetical protein A7U60_g3154 [Sanghuangporus baumii]|uniref:Uncharacterized protein n=1 Tax=Sanghuangporus baumii TaxID=108892 RepID=A0A9Q5I1S5_SANBA|nr:hypothetical protein A7U60_g3154 [Sanghuangporus baumii]
MTTIVGGHCLPTTSPRIGILLNASPTSSAPSSPKRNSYLSPCCPGGGVPGTHHPTISSHSSTSSTASSTDDIASSTSATSAAGSHASSSSTTGPQSSRKIRFAPLPERRRDEYDDDLLSPGFFDLMDGPAPSPKPATHLSPPPSPSLRPSTPLHSPNLSASHAQASCSTLGLSLDLDGAEVPDSGQATETNTVAGSECGTDDTHTLASARKMSARWARLIPFPRPSSFRPPRSADDHTGHPNLCRSPSRESTASGYSFRSVGLGRMFGSMSDSNASSSSLSNPLSRRKTVTGADSVPVSPTMSLQGGLSLKPVVSDAGITPTAVPRGRTHSQTSSAHSTVRRGTRLLNGRIYGRRPSTAPKNLFSNIRDDEPEFVEWGHGGMGSVRAGMGSTRWARLQSAKKLSIGHDDGTIAEDEDDGSGMAWVKKRREQRERERKEREEREAGEKAEQEKDVEDGDAREKSEQGEVTEDGEAKSLPESHGSEGVASKDEVEKP